MLCEIDLDLTLDPHDTDEPYASVIITMYPILICSLLKYESVPHHDTMNLLGSLYIYIFGIEKLKAILKLLLIS